MLYRVVILIMTELSFINLGKLKLDNGLYLRERKCNGTLHLAFLILAGNISLIEKLTAVCWMYRAVWETVS